MCPCRMATMLAMHTIQQVEEAQQEEEEREEQVPVQVELVTCCRRLWVNIMTLCLPANLKWKRAAAQCIRRTGNTA